jgi:hypothetical protein
MALRSSAKIGSFDVSSFPVAAMILRHRRKLQLQWDEDLRSSPMLSFRLAKWGQTRFQIFGMVTSCEKSIGNQG